MFGRWTDTRASAFLSTVVAFLPVFAANTASAQYTNPAPDWPNGTTYQMPITTGSTQTFTDCFNPAQNQTVTSPTTPGATANVVPPYFYKRGIQAPYAGTFSATPNSNPFSVTINNPLTGSTGYSSTLTYNYSMTGTVVTETLIDNAQFTGPGYNFGIFNENYIYTWSSVYDTSTGTQSFTWSYDANGTGSDAAQGSQYYLCSYSETTSEEGSTQVNWFGLEISPPAIATSLPAGFAGKSYGSTPLITGGSPPYTVSATGLPPGLSIGSDGTVSGTPSGSDSGTYTAMVSVTDTENGAAGPQPVTITIDPQLVIVSSLTSGQVGASYPATQLVSGGTPSYSVSVSGLPAGLTASSSGVISGTDQGASGIYTVMVSASDSVGATAGPVSISLTIGTAAPPPPMFSAQTKQDFQTAATGWGLVGSSLTQLAEECGGIPQCVEFFEAAALIANAAELPMDIIASDPVDPNYKSIAAPVPFKAFQVSAGSVWLGTSLPINALLTENAKVLALSRAVIIAHNRFDGAAAAGDSVWQQRQLLAAKAFSLKISRILEKQPLLLLDLDAILKRDRVKPLQATQAQIQSSLNAIAANGFSPATVAQLKLDGFTAGDVSTLKQAAGTLSATSAFSFPDGLIDRHFISPIVIAAQSAALFAADRNNDGKVDCSDVEIVQKALHTKVGDAKFDPRADVNGDGVVDYADIRAVLRSVSYGAHCDCDEGSKHRRK